MHTEKSAKEHLAQTTQDQKLDEKGDGDCHDLRQDEHDGWSCWVPDGQEGDSKDKEKHPKSGKDATPTVQWKKNVGEQGMTNQQKTQRHDNSPIGRPLNAGT